MDQQRVTKSIPAVPEVDGAVLKTVLDRGMFSVSSKQEKYSNVQLGIAGFDGAVPPCSVVFGGPNKFGVFEEPPVLGPNKEPKGLTLPPVLVDEVLPGVRLNNFPPVVVFPPVVPNQFWSLMIA